MLHPHTELRFVSPEIGYGIFATEDIPKGTITWVRDELDRTFSQEEVKTLTPPNFANLMKYTSRDKNGDFLFYWDLTRYMNHSFEPNSCITGLDFEVAIRDIKKGDEMTNDYGTLNVVEPFKCLKSSHTREYVRPDDLLNFYPEWDKQVTLAMSKVKSVSQPLERFLTFLQKTQIDDITSGKKTMPSLLESYYKA